MLTGQQLKEIGQAIVITPSYEWKDHAMHELRLFCIELNNSGQKEFAIEEFRRFCLDRGVKQPRHHNAWGALTSAAEKAGIIERTGVYRLARSPRTHAHPVMTWRPANG